MSDSTVEDYLKYNCDDNYLPDEHVDNSKINMIELAKLMNASLNASRLPIPEPTIFTGNPLEYPSWKCAFETLIESKSIQPTHRIHYLKKYLGGEAKSAVECTFYVNTDLNVAFNEAKETLDRRYGNTFLISEAIRDKLYKWPLIKTGDGLGLRAFADYLQQCNMAMKTVDGLSILNDCRENRRLLTKLPDCLIQRWSRIVSNEGTSYPPFSRFALFITKEADIMCNPMLSNIKPYVPDQKRPDRREQSAHAMTTVTDESTSKTVDKCEFCGKQFHNIIKCKLFAKKDHEERRKFIMSKGMCFSCLNRGHMSRTCPNRAICDTCNGRHPTSLCGDFVKWRTAVTSQGTADEEEDSKEEISKGTTLTVLNNEELDLTTMIVPVRVYSNNSNDWISTYALQDSQSDSTFILDSLADKLELKSEQIKLRLSTITATTTIATRKIEGLTISGINSSKMISINTTYTRNDIPVRRSHIPTRSTATKWSHLQSLRDKISEIQEFEIGMLIGYNCSDAIQPISVISGGVNEPYGVETYIGWSIVGATQVDHDCTDVITLKVPDDIMIGESHTNKVRYAMRTSCKEIINTLELDFIERKFENEVMSQEDLRFMNILKNETKIDADGFYELPLPFKKELPALPNNKLVAEKRLCQLKRRLTNNPILYDDYKACIDMMIENNYVEEVPPDEFSTPAWYIPHHAVYNTKKSAKARVVFDCSAQHLGQSLNDHLIQGPDLLNSLITVLCKFREDHIAFMGDIEKMFYRFKVKREHRNYLRFLWWKNGNMKSVPMTYRMTVHVFGAASSPGCANFALKRLAIDCKAACSDATHDFLLHCFYVDDGLYSTKTVTEALEVVTEARKVCAVGRLRLHKFISNNRELLEQIPESERTSSMECIDLHFDKLPVERALGICWNTESDTLQFNVNISSMEPQTPNRRRVLSIIASLYDPLGCIAPFILNGKLILQSMCKEDVKWDEPLPDHLLPRWNKWLEDLSLLESVNIPRCFVPKELSNITRRELHHFSDASTIGYGQCTYLRQIAANGDIHCSLVIGKARVAPLKIVTIPRLELTAALLSVKISKMLRSCFKYHIDEEYYWTDSTIVLSYMQNDSKRFHVYVANRIEQIKEHTISDQWHYVRSQDNPADGASRGLDIHHIMKSNWFKGPSFLWCSLLPTTEEIDGKLRDDDQEVRAHVMLAEHCSSNLVDVSLIDRFSNWTRAVKVIALCIRFKRIALGKMNGKLEQPDKIAELKYAQMCIIKLIQRHEYNKEIMQLTEKKQLQQGNRLLPLSPFVDQDGLLRVGGRIQQSSFLYGVKHPLIIPKKTHATHLIIGHYHKETCHQGRGITMNHIRSSGFWIIGCSNAVSSYIFKCVTCRKVRKTTESQMMSELPSERLEPSPPFTYCGVDCFGPFIVKDGRKCMKKYGLIVTCFASRAIHIECLDDMTTDCFINALRCVIAIRGPIRTIRCDQGTNFVGASHELQEAMREHLDDDAIKKHLCGQNCEFIFNSPHSSHMGGCWERCIRTIRSVLDVILHQHPSRLDTSSLRTFLYEVMAIVNSRPLTVQNISDPDAPLPLTPNQLLTCKTNVVVPPPGDFSDDDVYSRKRWRRVQGLANDFWHRWKKEFVLMLQNRQKWQLPKRNVQLNDIMLLTDEEVHRSRWKLGKVIEIIPSSDGRVRRVKLQVGDSYLATNGKRTKDLKILERPIHKLILIVENDVNPVNDV